MAGDSLEFEGIVVETSNSKFKVKVDENYTVLCSLSGKIRTNSVRILVGDRVRIQVSPYDVTQGRITYRIK